ncbi:MAG: fimbria/pilus periplasmic chaperone [Methylocella sp.]
MRCFLATALTAFFSFAWSDAEAATATGTFNVQVTIAPARKISRAFGVLLLPAWFAASDASAASLQAAPVLLEVVAPAAAATVTLRNNGAKPIATQVRVFRWIQEAGVERLEPTEDVVASPPAVELQPGEDYVARVVRVTKKPVEGEEAYRLFVDELPEAPQGRHTVNLVVRHSIPLFFDAPASSAPEAAWRVTQNGRAVSLSAVNGGDRRLRLASVRIGGAAGKSLSFGPGLVGYALGHSAMSWTAPRSRSVFRPGAKVTISGVTEAGPFNAQAVVQSAR